MKRRQFLDYSLKAAVAGSLSTQFNLSAFASASKTGLVFDERFKNHHIDPNHPESPERYFAIKQHFSAQDLFSKTNRIDPRENIEPWLKLVHSNQHIASIKAADLKTHENVSIATGGVLAAVDQVCRGNLKNAFCATRPPGHHARNTGKEEGFCYYNHVAIAARYAQQEYQLKKILIVDWDYHHGNGTEETFYADPSVLFFSTHDQFAYPGTGDPARKGEGEGLGFNKNIHLACGSGDKEIIHAFETELLTVADKFKPDLVLISAGFDSRENDLLGCHSVTDEGFAKLTKLVKAIADKHCQSRVISILEGGYNLQGNAKAATAHLIELMS